MRKRLSFGVILCPLLYHATVHGEEDLVDNFDPCVDPGLVMLSPVSIVETLTDNCSCSALICHSLAPGLVGRADRLVDISTLPKRRPFPDLWRPSQHLYRAVYLMMRAIPCSFHVSKSCHCSPIRMGVTI